MIRGLRRRHRLIWTVLFPALAILLAVALLSRPESPLMDEIPTARAVESETAAVTDGPPPGDEVP